MTEDVGLIEIAAIFMLAFAMGGLTVHLSSSNSTTDNPDPVQNKTEEVCVESHYEYTTSYQKGFQNLENVSEDIIFEKRNYTNIDGGVYLEINSTDVATDSAKIVYERVEICDKKANKTVEAR